MTELFAAIDLMDGEAVRLVRGEFDRRRHVGDPVALARSFVAAGASWLHVVDLDAARTGTPDNREIVLGIVETARRHGSRVQVGGGVRTVDDVDGLAEAGADRVVVGTVAVEDPALVVSWARRRPGSVAVALDYRRRPDGEVEPAVRGWSEGSGASMTGLLATFDGEPFGALVVTAIERDGTLGGPDVGGLCDALDATSLPVVGSGGIGGVADLRQLAALRSPRAGRALAGVVVGTALVDGTMGVEEAVAACAR